MADHDREEKECREDQTVSTLGWFLTGAAIGVAAAMLYAPKSGKETRQYLTDKAQEGREAVESASQDIVDASRDMFERGRKLVEDAADLFDRGRKLVKG
jgi:gas vesicle protein